MTTCCFINCVVVWVGKPTKKDEPLKDERKRVDQSGIPPKADTGMPRSAPGNRGHPMNAPPMGPGVGYGSHKDIKLTLLNKVAAYLKIIYIYLNLSSSQVVNHLFLPCICSNKQIEAIERGTSLLTKTDQHLLSAREWHCLLIEVRICQIPE